MATKGKGIEAVHLELAGYSDEVKDMLEETVTEVMDEAVDKLHTAGGFKGTKYKHSWTSKVERTRTGISGVTYNAKHYRLTHLLEFGHARRGGGRNTTAYEHIAPVNDWAQEEVERRMEDKLK